MGSHLPAAELRKFLGQEVRLDEAGELELASGPLTLSDVRFVLAHEVGSSFALVGDPKLRIVNRRLPGRLLHRIQLEALHGLRQILDVEAEDKLIRVAYAAEERALANPVLEPQRLGAVMDLAPEVEILGRERDPERTLHQIARPTPDLARARPWA